jgi:hypothetical protein
MTKCCHKRLLGLTDIKRIGIDILHRGACQKGFSFSDLHHFRMPAQKHAPVL